MKKIGLGMWVSIAVVLIVTIFNLTEVYEKFEKYSRTAGNPISIHYTFRLPEQDGVPALEVLVQPTAKTA